MTSTRPPTEPTSGSPFAVQFVCTGNICRSPFAERLLRYRLPHLHVASSGIFAVEGHPMETRMAHELSTRHGDPAGFRARQVSASDLGSDLILSLSRRQRTHLVDEFPGAARRTGLLGHVPELVELHRQQDDAPLPVSIAAWTRMALPSGRDVPDPYGAGPAVAASSAALISDLIDQLVPVLRAAVPGGPSRR